MKTMFLSPLRSSILQCLLLFALSSTHANEKELDPIIRNGTKKGSVLIFVGTDCPIANRMLPEIKRLHEEYSAKGIQWTLVYPETTLTQKDLEQHAQEYQFTIPSVIDKTHQLVKTAKAKITPEAALFDSKGVLIYHGRINDLYLTYSKQRAQPRKHELKEALEALLARKEIKNTHVPAIGCLIQTP